MRCSCLCVRQVSIHLCELAKEGFVEEVLPRRRVFGREVADDCSPALAVHRQDDAHGHFSDRGSAVLHCGRTELGERTSVGFKWWGTGR